MSKMKRISVIYIFKTSITKQTLLFLYHRVTIFVILILHRVRQIFENQVTREKGADTGDTIESFSTIYCSVQVNTKCMTSFDETAVSRNNSLYTLSKPLAGSNEVGLGNVCHCIHNSCPESCNGVVWMLIGCPLNHAPDVIV